MNIALVQLFFGFVLGGLVSGLAWKAQALNNSGAWAAALVGGLIFGLGGMSWALVLLAFFISSSLLSQAFEGRKADLRQTFAKSGQRDWAQVAANGGLAALLTVVHALFPGQVWPWVAFAGAVAAANADTWATELGVLNPTPPRRITTGKPVDRGTSGGVSLYGLLASLAGAALIGLVAGIFTDPFQILMLIAAAVAGGFAGSLFDSLLGATLQAIYRCSRCKKETERYPLHTCGNPTRRVRGLSWMTNDMVNFLASVLGAAVAVSVFGLMI